MDAATSPVLLLHEERCRRNIAWMAERARRLGVRLRPGDVLGVVPVHACLTAQAMGGYPTPGGQPVDHASRLPPPGSG